MLASACAAAIGAGLWIRLWMLAHVGIQSDQATAGLMAERILDGQFYALFWGQHYGGVEPYVVAAMFGVFGRHAYLINLTATILVAGATVLVGYLGALVTGRRALGAVAACIAWVWPWAALWSSTRDTGFRAVTLVCGLGALVAAYRIVLRDSHVLDWVLLGAAGGVGLWSSVEIVYFAVPVAVLLVVSVASRRTRLGIGRVAAALCTFAACVSPWLVDNAHTGFATLRTTAIGPATSYWSRLDLFFTEMLPAQFGLKTATGLLAQRTPVRWVFGAAPSEALYVLIGAVVVAGVVAVLVSGALGAKALVSFVAAFPFIYALFPPTDLWYDGRYGVLLPPVLVVVVVCGWALLAGRARRRSTREEPGRRAAAPRLRAHGFPAPAVWLAAVVVAALTAATVFVFSDEAPRARATSSLLSVGDDGAGQVARELAAAHVRTVVADYWAAYDLDFLGRGALSVTSLDSVRVPSTFRRVLASRAAWLFVGRARGDAQAARGDFQSFDAGPATMTVGWFTETLRALRIRYTTVRAGPMVAVRPRAPSARWLLTKLDPIWAASPANRHGLVPSPVCHCGTGP